MDPQVRVSIQKLLERSVTAARRTTGVSEEEAIKAAAKRR